MKINTFIYLISKLQVTSKIQMVEPKHELCSMEIFGRVYLHKGLSKVLILSIKNALHSLREILSTHPLTLLLVEAEHQAELDELH